MLIALLTVYLKWCTYSFFLRPGQWNWYNFLLLLYFTKLFLDFTMARSVLESSNQLKKLHFFWKISLTEQNENVFRDHWYDKLTAILSEGNISICFIHLEKYNQHKFNMWLVFQKLFKLLWNWLSFQQNLCWIHKHSKWPKVYLFSTYYISFFIKAQECFLLLIKLWY